MKRAFSRPEPVEGSYSFKSLELAFGRSAYRAGVSASAAFDADFGIDFILAVALADGGNGTFSSTCTAADAFIGNFVSHLIYLLIFDRTYV